MQKRGFTTTTTGTMATGLRRWWGGRKAAVGGTPTKAGARRRGGSGGRRDVIEALESRQLLTTLYGGGPGRLAVYTFATDSATVPDAQIYIYGDVVAEFIFMHGATQEVVNRNVTITSTGGTGPAVPGSVSQVGTLGLNVFSDNPTQPVGSNIFAIYVAKADINSYISVVSWSSSTGQITPFGGGTGFDIFPDNSKGPTVSVTVPGGIGSLQLGATTHTPSPGLNLPIIKTDINGAAIGVRPAGLDDLPDDPTNDLSAGLRVANGQNLGKFLFDGEIFGQVHVDGSMNMFYGGWILTGDARGASDGSFTTSGYPVSSFDTITQADINAGETTGHLVPRQNFYIGGDLQTLASPGALGWDTTFGTGGPLAPFYDAGTDIYVRGRLGNVQANTGSVATITAANMDPSVGFTRGTAVQEELESLNAPVGSGVAGDVTFGFPNTPRSDFAGGLPYQPGTSPIVPFRNDTFNSFQFLGTFDSDRGNDIIDVIGNIDTLAPTAVHDPNDYYGISLLAGQTVRVQLLSMLTNYAHVGVFDPDGRLIATDYTNVSTPVSGATSTNTYSYNLPFQFTADRPGIYRVAIGGLTDPTFTGGATLLTSDYYRLTITNVGALAIGGVRIGNSESGLSADGSDQLLDINDVPPVVQSLNGDIGGIYASGRMYVVSFRDVFANPAPAPPGSVSFQFQYGSFKVVGGSLRAFDFTSLGISNTGDTGPDLYVPDGNVGLVQARDPAGILELNPSIPINFTATATAVIKSPTSPAPVTLAQVQIGGNYQVINAAGNFMGGVVTRKGMGILRANSINGPSGQQPLILLDSDNSGFDGKSDLIDIASDIVIGPALYHGPGGNFRYFRCGGFVTVDSQFGTSNLGYVPHNYGETVTLTDDSGSNITMTPTGQRVVNPAWTPLDPTQGPQFFLPQLTTLAYPVRSGGVIVMDVESTGSINIRSSAGAFNGTAELSRVEVHGTGTAPLVTTRFTKSGYQTTLTQPFNSPALGTSLSVDISGSAVTDVAYVVGMVPEATLNFFNNGANTATGLGNIVPSFRSLETAFSNLTSVSNTTGGEILSVNAANVGTIYSSGTVGITRTTSIPGNSLNFIAPITIGTGYGARAETVAADNAPVNPAGTAIGSAFPFDKQTFGVAVGGNIVSVRADRGLGNIIATGIIGSVVANADHKNVGNAFEGINGPVWADFDSLTINPNTQFGVGNGSILSVDIGEGMGSAGTGDFARTGIFAGGSIESITGNNADIRGDIVFGDELRSLTLNNGSLIDANILHMFNLGAVSVLEFAAGGTTIGFNPSGVIRSLGSITITGKGGIIGTSINASTIGPVRVDGFGIISSQITTNFAGTGISNFTVGGYGIRDTIISAGNNISFINLTGNGSSLSTRNVTTSVRQSETVRADPNLSFAFDPFSGRALSPLNDIHAALGTSQATPNIKGVTDTGVLENTQITSQRALGTITAQVIRSDNDGSGIPLSRIFAGNSIDTIKTRGLINGLQVTTGTIKHFEPGSDVLNLRLTISGFLSTLKINGTLGGGSVIEAIGPNGRIGNVSIKRDLKGTIHAVETIGTVTIGRNLSGLLKVDALGRGGRALDKLQVGGTISNGSLEVGAAGNPASVGTIIVGKSLGTAGGSDHLTVSGGIDRLQVGGTLFAAVKASKIGTLQAARVNGRVQAGTVSNLRILKNGLHGDLVIGGRLENATITGGIAANVSANNGIGTITLNSGDVAANKSITSGFGPIGTLRIKKGNLFGSVNAAGKIGQIIVAGNVGDGTDPMTITGTRLGLLQVGGSIRNNAQIHISGPIDSLIVGNNIDAGAVVQASALNKQKIGGQVFGTLLIG